MKIKRIQAKNIRIGMRKMKQELGDDAVILSNRKLGDSVELIVGVDYKPDFLRSLNLPAASSRPHNNVAPSTLQNDTASYISQYMPAQNTNVPTAKPVQRKKTSQAKYVSRADVVRMQQPLVKGMRKELNLLGMQLKNQIDYIGWGRWNQELPLQATVLRKLTAIGLGSQFCKQIIRCVDHEPNVEKAWRRALGIWASHIKLSNYSVLERGGVIALVGPTGVGKTTTAAKLAAKFAERHGEHSVLLVANDNQRFGAHEQLLSLGRMLNISVVSAADDEELRIILRSVRNKKLVLIDMAGLRASDPRIESQSRILEDSSLNIKTYLVASCSVQIGALDDMARYYKNRSVQGCILTKLDEAVSLGGVLTVVAQHELPLSYITHGPEVPDDIQPARVSLLLSKAVALSKAQQCEPDEDIMAMRFGSSIEKTAVLQ